jgi:hypothetical protein
MDKHSETETYYTGSKLENISTVKCEILSKTGNFYIHNAIEVCFVKKILND